jgi:hypothetical protein
LLDNIVDDSNPGSLDKIDIVSEEERYGPIFAILFSILKSDFE